MSCLLSKLNGEVDNASLPKVGELILHVDNQLPSFKSTNCFRIWPDVNTPITVEVIGDGLLSSDSNGSDTFTSRTFQTASVKSYFLYVSPGSYDVRFSNKYAMSMDYVSACCTNDISDFFYIQGTHQVSFGVRSTSAIGNAKITGSLSDVAKLKQDINGLEFSYCVNMTGDLSDLLNLDASKIRTLVFNSSTNLTGNIEVLAYFTSLTSLQVSNKSLTGDIKNLFDALYDNGRTSGTLAVNVSTLGPTYEGEHPSGWTTYTATFTSEGWTVAITH